MKSFGKHFLPEIHLNPIGRDLVLVTTSGLLVAMAAITLVVMIISQF